MMTYLNMFSHHRLKSRIGSSDDLTPNAEFSGALVVDGTRNRGMRVRWNEQLGGSLVVMDFYLFSLTHRLSFINSLAPSISNAHFAISRTLSSLSVSSRATALAFSLSPIQPSPSAAP